MYGLEFVKINELRGSMEAISMKEYGGRKDFNSRFGRKVFMIGILIELTSRSVKVILSENSDIGTEKKENYKNF